MPEITRDEFDRLSGDVSAFSQRLSALRRDFEDDLNDAMSGHLGLDWASSGLNYPHPSIGLSLTSVVTGNYSAQAGDFVLASGTLTVTLPAAQIINQQIGIKNIGTGTLTIAASGSDLIDGQSSQPLLSQYDSYTLISDGTGNWYIL